MSSCGNGKLVTHLLHVVSAKLFQAYSLLFTPWGLWNLPSKFILPYFLLFHAWDISLQILMQLRNYLYYDE